MAALGLSLDGIPDRHSVLWVAFGHDPRQLVIRMEAGKEGGGGLLMSCMATVVSPSTLASLQCRDGARRVFTGQGGVGLLYNTKKTHGHSTGISPERVDKAELQLHSSRTAVELHTAKAAVQVNES